MLVKVWCLNCHCKGTVSLPWEDSEEPDQGFECSECQGKGYIETDVLDGVIEEKLEQQ